VRLKGALSDNEMVTAYLAVLLRIAVSFLLRSVGKNTVFGFILIRSSIE